MIFIDYAKNHAGDCYCIYNPVTGYMTETRDIAWLHDMYYGKPEARDKIVVYLHMAILPVLEDAEARESVMINASESKTKSKIKKINGILCA